MIPHHQKGCINCGELRTGKETLLVTTDRGSIMRIGLCKACHNSEDELDLNELKETLYSQERQLLIDQNKPESLADQILKILFVSAKKS